MIIIGAWTIISIIAIGLDDHYSIMHFHEEWQRVLIGGVLGCATLSFFIGVHKIINPALDNPGMQETNPTWHLALLISLLIGIDIMGFVSIIHIIKMLIDHKGKL